MSMIEKSLVHYEITAEIGKGGMGEVYQAKDTKLGRDVAIKVLPEEFARDTDRVARFQREAKLLASLNHPNIAAIYGLEESGGTHFLVMELIEGETLKDRIKSGPIPVEEALKLVLQIAEGLEAAHENGVIHRDLKPANIKVTPDGKVKILDFGLAKAYAGDQGNLSPLDSPTISAAATQQGVILGTAAYMSPEQARGKSVDRRADIWAFGVVLYEMLTGKAAFSGTDVTDTLAAVIRSEPEWKSLPANLHWRLREVLERCLEKRAKDRYSGISDARVDIQKALADPSGILVQPISVAESRMKWRTNLSWIAAIVLVAIITGIAFWLLWSTSPEPRITRFEVELAGIVDTGLGSVALSPDGSRFVYPANGQLYVHALDQLEPTPIPGTENGSQPFFSPDGESIGFSTGTQLKSVSLTGVAPVVLADVGKGPSSGQALIGVWDSANRIFFGQAGSYGLSQIPAVGGTPEPFVELGDHADLDYPDVLPGGEWIIFTDNVTSGNWSNANIVAQSIATGERKVILEGGHFARYAPTGHLVYAQNGNLLGIGFDAKRVKVTGKAVQLIQNVATNEMSGHAQFAIAADGTLAYIPGTASGAILPQRTLVWVNQEGIEEPLLAEPNAYLFPKLSPDGSKVVLAIGDAENQDIWIWDIVRETMTRLTFSEGMEIQPIWTPDGNRVVFFSTREKPGVYWKNADGTGKAEFLGSVPDRLLFPWCFSKDGSTLINGELIGGDRMDIGMLSMEGDHEHSPLLTEEYVEMQPKISPDGRWMAYTALESDHWGVYVRPFPDVDKGKWQVSPGIGIGPLWSTDGKELFYRSPDGIMAVPVDTEPTFKLGKPKVLFPDTYISLLGGGSEGHAWDIHPDGERFLMMKPFDVATPEEGSPKPKIIIVRNWFEELKERVPVD
jgi:serine/threonine protein kinase